MRINISHQRIWFCSDFHLSHKNIIKFDGRPFDNIDEMNQALEDNWNLHVGKDDVVFFLGDLSFNKKGTSTKELVNRLNGTIHYVLGNHDDIDFIESLNRFETINDYVHLSVVDEDIDINNIKNKIKYQEIILMHYPILEWDKCHRGSWHLHGHTHQSLINSNIEYYKQKVLDVSCNGWDYKPVSYIDIKNIMKNKILSKHH